VLGPQPDRTLYAILGERVAASGLAAGRPLAMLVVLVSAATEAETRKAFAEGRQEWGLGATDVRFVRQGELPVMGTDARALLEAPGVLATAPDGHGGAFEALARAGLLEEMRERGVDAICSFQVDNPLARPLDPVMLGWMVERRAQVVGKAVRKRSPDERVGVFARDLRGRHRIVEYTEIPDGGLPPDVDLGSIAVGAYGVAFLDDLWRQGLRLPLHRAKKKAPYLDRDGRRVEPAEPNAIKLERFVFDLLPHAPRVEVHEVLREREFAPVKNAEGDDSPSTARALVAAEVARLHAEAGEPLSGPPDLRPLRLLEYRELGVPSRA
jgi:UDP-N-acetylglucosamine/UDP-N-acetylgalactosamine diphosphorylase